MEDGDGVTAPYYRKTMLVCSALVQILKYALMGEESLQPAANSHPLKTGYNTLISALIGGGFAMVSHLFFYQLTLIALVWLCVMLHRVWPSDSAACPTIPEPLPPRPKRKRE